MNNQNSHFDHDFYRNGANEEKRSYQTGNTYEYVFSSGHNGAPDGKPPKGNGGGRRVLLSVVTVLLCVSLSFLAGFGGAYYAFRLADANSQGKALNAAPSKDDLYSNDPEGLLDKAQSAASVYGSAGEDVFSVSQVVKKVEDAVVVIDVTVTTGNSWFGSQTSTGSGSGVIISQDGYILTCHHVVDGALSITVTLNSGNRYEAALVGSDSASDLAVIKIEPKETLTYAEQGCSADLVAGEHVVAIGNPLGTLGGTVTDGIISALERNIRTSDGNVMTLLQTNAAINSGNSGGGLFNLDGKLIGIVNAKYAAEGVEGLAFAIPIDSAYTVQLDLIEYGYVRGVIDSGLDTMDINFDNFTWTQQTQYKQKFGIHCSGVYVISSEYCSELENADRIIAINGTAVNSSAELTSLLSKYQVGDTVTVTASRNAVEFTATLTLREYIPDYIEQK